jgi:hypothetical protein
MMSAIVKLVLTTLAAVEAARKTYRTLFSTQLNELNRKGGSADMVSVSASRVSAGMISTSECTTVRELQEKLTRRSSRLRKKQ